MEFLTLRGEGRYLGRYGYAYRNYAIESQDGIVEMVNSEDRNVAVNECLKKGFTAPKNEIAKFLTWRTDQLVLFRKYNKKKRTNPKNPNSGK